MNNQNDYSKGHQDIAYRDLMCSSILVANPGCSIPLNTSDYREIHKVMKEGRIWIFRHVTDPRKDKAFCGVCGMEMIICHLCKRG